MSINTFGTGLEISRLKHETKILANSLLSGDNDLTSQVAILTTQITTLTSQLNSALNDIGILQGQMNSMKRTKTNGLMNTAMSVPINNFVRGGVVSIWGSQPIAHKNVKEYWSVESQGRWRLKFSFAADLASITSDFQNALLPGAIVKMLVKTGSPFTAVDYNTIKSEGNTNYSQAGGGICSPTLISVPNNMSYRWDFICEVASDAATLPYYIAFLTCEDFDHHVFTNPRFIGFSSESLEVDVVDEANMMTDAGNYTVDVV